MSQKHIGSYAFFDLETTGLPDFEFNKTKITEISLVACSRDNILNTEKDKLPRVLNKLSFCVNPFKLISQESTKITGLDNFLLENEKKFDENSVKLLNNFLLQLQQPVCLVAHNGDKFDFPIIQSQLAMLNSTVPDDLCCVDTLPFFRSLEDHLQDLLNEPTKLLDEPQKLLDEPQTLLEEPQKLLDEPNDVTVEVHLEKPLTENSIETNDLSKDDVTPSHKADIKIIQPSTSTESTFDNLDENNVIIALLDEDVKKHQQLNETTPSNRKTLVKQKLFSKKPVVHGIRSITPRSKRELFSSIESQNSANPSKRMKFTLSAIYQRFFGTEPYQSHYAESDTLALLKCAIAANTKFIEYAEKNANIFSDIKPLGMK